MSWPVRADQWRPRKLPGHCVWPLGSCTWPAGIPAALRLPAWLPFLWNTMQPYLQKLLCYTLEELYKQIHYSSSLKNSNIHELFLENWKMLYIYVRFCILFYKMCIYERKTLQGAVFRNDGTWWCSDDALNKILIGLFHWLLDYCRKKILTRFAHHNNCYKWIFVA